MFLVGSRMRKKREEKLEQLLQEVEMLLSSAKMKDDVRRDMRREMLENINQQVAIVRLLQAEDRLGKNLVVASLGFFGGVFVSTAPELLKLLK